MVGRMSLSADEDGAILRRRRTLPGSNSPLRIMSTHIAGGGENCSHHQKMWRKLRTVWHCSGKLAPGWKPPRLAPLETRTELSSELPRSWHHVHRMGDHGDMIFCRPRLQLSSALCDQLRQLSHRGFSHLTWPLADPSDGWPSTGQDLPCTSGRNLLEGVSCRVPRLLSDPPPTTVQLVAELHELLCPLWRWTISRKLRNLCHGLPTLCGCSKEILIDLFAKSLDECFALCDPLHVQLLLLLGEPQRLRGLCNLVVGTLQPLPRSLDELERMVDLWRRDFRGILGLLQRLLENMQLLSVLRPQHLDGCLDTHNLRQCCGPVVVGRAANALWW